MDIFVIAMFVYLVIDKIVDGIVSTKKAKYGVKEDKSEGKWDVERG